MSVRAVMMYRVQCDAHGCNAGPDDDTDYYAWADAEQARAAADDLDRYGWYRGVRGDLCPEHAPVCLHDGCTVQLWDDEFGVVCEDHEEDQVVTQSPAVAVAPRSAAAGTNPGEETGCPSSASPQEAGHAGQPASRVPGTQRQEDS